jgi:superfamily II DNA or RNA helicase
MSKAKEIQSLIAQCDLIITDEADLSCTSQYAQLYRNYFHGRRKYGLSGTPFDKSKPVQNLLLKENMGNVIFEAGREEVQAVGRIIPIKYIMIAVEPDDREDARAYDIALREDLVENEPFQDLIASIPAAFPSDGTLILVDTSPIEPLGRALEQKIPNSKFIFGTTPAPERRKYIELFENRKLTCLIGSKILKRGLDLEGGVENLVIVGGGAKWSDFEQKVGRAVRKNKRGWARVFGFFFLTNKYLYRHSREQLKALVNMGYEAKVVIGGREIDGTKFVHSRFRIPKQI